MEDAPGDAGHSEPGPSNTTWWPSDFMEEFQSVSLVPQEHNLSSSDSSGNVGQAEPSSQSASQALWSTGTLSGPIPNGFYSVLPDRKLKQLFDAIPSPDELHSLGLALKAEIILVDSEKDKKLSMLKQLSTALVKGLNSNPASVIKKIAGLVSDFYKRPNPELSPAKATAEEIGHLMENRGIQLLGQIRHGSCRPRAILFKVLADAIGLECKLMAGLTSDGSVEYTDSYKHMTAIVVLKSVESLVDLMRFPGKLIPFSAKAIFMSHFSAAGESDLADYDSCDSPLESNSPLCGFYDRTDGACQEQDGNFRSLYQQRMDLSLNAAGSSLRNIMLKSRTFVEGKLSSSHSVPNIENGFWKRGRKKATASSSPEHPLTGARGRSMLSGCRHSFREYADDGATSRSDGAPTSNVRRARRRSISFTPEIGDDIVRAVRAMNDKLKQSRLLCDQRDENSSLHPKNEKNIIDSPENVSSYCSDGHDEVSRGVPGAYNSSRRQSQKAISLPSSPHEFRGHASDISGVSDLLSTEDLISTWNKVLKSSPYWNKPLVPFQEWNIEFSELTVGTRVGIGFFGEVFRGMWNGTDVAIKVFLEQDLTAENMEDFCNEISILSRLRHPNVILFLGACMRPPHLSMVTEYMEMGSLYYLIHSSGQKKKLSWRRRLKMLRDICRGLMCMHRTKIVHRDLKSANCLVNKHWTVKICDFGLSRIMTEVPMSDNSSAGTPEWMAPELIRSEPFTEKCDIFSLGVIMWELCTLSRPWQGVPSVQVVYSVANKGTRLEIPEGPLGSLISDCWAEPEKRPSCQEILTRLLDCEYTLC
ncbi:serine/threonine-protein kinase EDR1-like [Phoenix dactylifera]|uniref:non-specific serine/threonine protein kinase n=1 Tax=Phoenix dactylifera TaxID=42345 RepID=A0A8B9AM70_PHODC|nr:serine/threonine-protein kinase EDR1-like [Phoenix dactylifera]XP_038985118.1 serine/threonine-protein kinase EDR1-like [Phoenix dactylifera]